MSHALKNNLASPQNWRPSATLDALRQRALLIKNLRDFFAARHILEVETPLLCHTSVTDPHIHSIPALVSNHPHAGEKRYYLQTSPEYAMKRLLAAGSGAIYQISKAFRQEEVGRWHNPEFTMLEWYRPDFDHHDLMNEVDELLQFILQVPAAERLSYADLFHHKLNIDAHHATINELAAVATHHDLVINHPITDRDTWLNVLMTHLIEPQLGHAKPCFIYDYPASQAALARIKPGNPPVASRFEVYCQGIELANGFHELQDANEQRQRFQHNQKEREQLGLEVLTIDELFLASLEHGLPDCAGVALGIDRLVMLAMKADHISAAMSFAFECC